MGGRCPIASATSASLPQAGWGTRQGHWLGTAWGGREMADKVQRPPHLTAHRVAHRCASSSLQGGIFFHLLQMSVFVPPKTRTLTQIGHKVCSTRGVLPSVSRVGFAGWGGGVRLTGSLKLMEASALINTWGPSNTLHAKVWAGRELSPEHRALMAAHQQPAP